MPDVNDPRSDGLKRLRRWWPALLLGVAALATATLVACGGGGSKNEEVQTDSPTPETTAAATVTGTPPAASGGMLTPVPGTPIDPSVLNRPTTEAPRGDFSGDRLVIPGIGVDAPFVSLTVGGDGQMPDPQGPTEVAWYDFSAWPGKGGVPGAGGNSVFSGHVDYHNYGPAVFWRLHELSAGDLIEVKMQGGASFQYQVQWNHEVGPEPGIWNDIVAATAQESVTLITCGGTWNPDTREYDLRQVVYATRVN